MLTSSIPSELGLLSNLQVTQSLKPLYGVLSHVQYLGLRLNLLIILTLSLGHVSVFQHADVFHSFGAGQAN